MPLRATPLPFTPRLILGAPEGAGVYALWRDGDVIYIGHALGGPVSIRSRLVDHFSGVAGPCTRRATHFSWVLSSDPAGDEAAALEEYRAGSQRLPLCNARR